MSPNLGLHRHRCPPPPPHPLSLSFPTGLQGIRQGSRASALDDAIVLFPAVPSSSVRVQGAVPPQPSPLSLSLPVGLPSSASPVPSQPSPDSPLSLSLPFPPCPPLPRQSGSHRHCLACFASPSPVATWDTVTS
ncbi:hypothetical protein ACLOJK_011170 [Asimina triloba]